MAFDPAEIERPVTDYRQYRMARLPNRLRVLVVSDHKCDRAAAALSVQVGSLFDPTEVQGLAHFLEHMLFLGTEKYPDEGEYNAYLAKNGGFSNAYTAESLTNYFFGVKPEALGGALDRFAQFFICPLFTASATERELLAVDSEHSKNLQQDGWRQSQLLRNAVNPLHPLHHFMTGNSVTLRDNPAKNSIDVRQALLDFHAKYYSANVMNLVIVGRETPEELLAMAYESFTPVIDRQVQVLTGEEIGQGHEAFPPERRARLVHVVPVTNVKSACFQFIIPTQKENWRSKPSMYVSHLLGHEGAGSLLAALKQRGLATELHAGDSLDEAGVGMLSVNVILTDAGERDVGTVGGLLFAYIKLLQGSDPSEDIFRELQRIGDLGFRFRSISDAVQTASTLAHTLPDYPPECLLSAGAKLWNYEPSQIVDILGCLKCENLRLVLSSQTYESVCTTREPWYGTPYVDEPLPDEWRARWETAGQAERIPELAVPLPNPFVPEDLGLRPPDEFEHPATPDRLDLQCEINGLSADRVATVFFRKDEQFGMPKASCAFQLYCPWAGESASQRVLAELWCVAVQEELNEFAYEAQVAGLRYSLQATPAGMVVGVSGYNDKLPVLLAAVADKMARLIEVPEASFTIAYRILERNLDIAATRSPPHHQASAREQWSLLTPAHTVFERLTAVRAITSRDVLRGIGRKLLDQCHVECLVQGNLTKDEARGLVKNFLGVLSIQRPLDALPPRGVAVLPSGWTYMKRQGTNPEERNGSVLVTLQVAEENLWNRCLTDLVGQVLGQRFFDDLRTKQQLGYIVSASAYGERSCFVGMRMLVQSERPTDEVVDRVREWLDGAMNFLESGLTAAEFEEYKAALISLHRERPKSLGEEFGRNWSEVASRGFEFLWSQEAATQLEHISLADLRAFVRERFRAAPALCTLITPGGEAPHVEARGALPPGFARCWSVPEEVAAFRRTATWRFRNASLDTTAEMAKASARSRL